MFTRARLKLAGWYAAVMSLTIVVVGGAAYILLRNDLNHEIDDSIRSAEALLQDLPVLPGERERAGVDDGGGDNRHDDDSDHEDDEPPIALVSEVFYLVLTDDGSVVLNPRDVDLDGIDLQELVSEAGDDELRDVRGEHGSYRLSVAEREEHDEEFVVVGRSLRLRDHQLNSLASVFLLGGGAAVGLAASSGFLLAGRTLAPIRRSYESQQQFVSDASHELRTPLAIARLQTEILTEDTNATIESRMEQVEAIAIQVDRMTALVGDLLTLARADEGRDNLVFQDVDLHALTGDVVHDMQALAELREVQLESAVEAVRCRGDAARLRQMLVILIDNALKYTPSGGRVLVGCRHEGNHAELTVSDTGPGIAPADQRRIFERFYRADSARGRGTGGTGLGLAIAAWIARAHRGRISVQSEPGNGATFRVRLPGA